MGGVVYILNIIKTLNFLDDKEKPEILVFYEPDLERFLYELEYPYLKIIRWHFPSIVNGNVKSLLLRKNVFVENILKNFTLDAIYPLVDFPVRINTNVKLISWSADLQHKYYPEFFSQIQILSRNIRTKFVLHNCDYLVVSSQTVLEDFAKFFKIREDFNIHVFHFVSIVDNLDYVDVDELLTKYKLPGKFFLVSNQFHKHKNHKVILLALVRLKGMGIMKHIAFTGKFPNDTDSPYLAELHRIIEDNELKDQITMLGIISRNEQLQLMKQSQAVLQPSLFEGWSTVIEDAKSLQVPVVASNLEVNIEQLGKDGVYFDPHNPEELASILKNYPERNQNDVFYEDYSLRIREAASKLLKIFQ